MSGRFTLESVAGIVWNMQLLTFDGIVLCRHVKMPPSEGWASPFQIECHVFYKFLNFYEPLPPANRLPLATNAEENDLVLFGVTMV
ncbi:hypothetical protein UWK_01233 [Desulfocapsa sulfexigens DSM 10523]|uniref:Uncharacterized protein n=2 Tax=Desulfocapsa TaxID=53318 RepID=M1NDG3_DESSD|nr:hypothetical protein UWK_01233 [Desulfocapsa sulfexigens DSM 10523]